ncbi:PQQ-binding-like beta-propeller repeat protein [Micromonospora sp. WMMA1998]|uniref:outer membrane protein assembly factor BamB family protein n=1 Tax=Micromonospora sp. WMMA1998 TaxID=3015167 RepID=UPI00248BD93A|nr:PQQ-binding-like beta-propeller repeat protein [Micromonospora sp. WMMA1998]WBC14728.1 PQQ-binding-like beta-propeller repeat protein [Micromonospora sp. WMMA1998]
MTVIDLGELRDDPASDVPGRAPRAVGRPFRVLVVLLVALVTLASATPPARPARWTVPAGTGASAFVAGDRVYVVRPLDWRPGALREVVAYRDGRERWRSRLPSPGDVVSVWEMGDRVLAAGPNGPDEAWQTVALETATGRLSWRQPALGYPAGDALLLQPTTGSGPQEVRRVAVADGRTLWTAPATPDLRFVLGPAGVEGLLVVPESGETVVLDAVTGERLAARDLHPGELPTQRRVLTAGDLVLEIREDGVAAYQRDTLRSRWTADLPLLDYVDTCGGVLCASRQTGGMWGLDPATGAVRWTIDRWAGVWKADGGRLLVGASESDDGHLAVLDADDGRLVADLAGWTAVPPSEVGGPLFLTRPLGGGRLLLAELDLPGGRLPVRGVLSGVDCSAGRALVVCRDGDGDFAVRRLP